MGIDSEDGGPGGHGPITVYIDVVESLLSTVGNGNSGILVIGEDGSPSVVTSFWQQVDNGIPDHSVTFVGGASSIETADFSTYAALAVVTSEWTVGSSTGGLTNAENDALISRAGDVATFVNRGGGLFASSQTGLTNPWGFIGDLGDFTTSTGSSYGNIDPTNEGLAVGVTNDLDICCWHDVFTAWPDFLEVLAWRSGSQTQAAALGGEGVMLTPPGPQNLTVQPGPELGQLSLDWDPPEDVSNISHYNIYSGPSLGDVSFLNNVSVGQTDYVDAGLGDGTPRCYQVTAQNSTGESEPSNTECATTFDVPSAPTAFTVTTGADPGTLNLSWEAPEDDGMLPILHYNVYGNSSVEGPFELLATVSGGSFQDSGLADGATRFYQVTAENEVGESDPAGPFGSTTQPGEDPEPLPEGRSATAAAFQGRYAYVFGGRSQDDNATDSIIRFDPHSGNTTVLNTTLPTPRLGMSAIWATGNQSGPGAQHCHGSCFEDNGFLFGGKEIELALMGGPVGPEHCHGSCRGGKEILEFDPDGEVIDTMDAEFPDAIFGSSSVWDPVNEVAYIFGGFPVDDEAEDSVSPSHCHGSCRAGEKIFQYDPAGDILEQQSEALPAPMGGTSAVWDTVNNVAYIFGGLSDESEDPAAQHCHGSCRSSILEFDPNDNVDMQSVEPLPVQLPSDRWNTSAVFDGRYAYIIGGENEIGPIDEIVRFDPVQMEVEVVGSLPAERAQTSAVFDGNDAYVFGGLEADDNSTNDIAKFTPRAPQQASAEAGPGPGQVTVSWAPPSNDGGEPVDSYRIYRSLGGQGTFLLVADLDVDTELSSSTGDLFFVDDGLADSAEYEYRVSAVNVVGEGPQSPEVPVRTFGVPEAPQAVSTTPGPGWGEITVEWAAPEDDGGTPVLAYNVYRADTSGGTFTLIGTDATGDRSFKDTGLDDLDTRYYMVSAVNVVGEGPPSDEVEGQSFDPMNLFVQPGGITIQQAADVVAQGGTIHLAPGVYPEEVALSTAATIQPGVADGPGPDAVEEGGPSVIEGSLRVQGSPLLILKDVQIEATQSGSQRGIALSTQGVASVEILNATFHADGESKGPGFFPGLVDLRGVQTLAFMDNMIVGDPGVPGAPSGLRVQYAQGADATVQVVGNEISGVKGAGIALTGDGPQAAIEVSGNHLEENGDGLHVFNAVFGDLSVTHNDVEGHDGVGVRFTGTLDGDPVLRYNAFTGNGVGVTGAGEPGSVDARHNWWGHAGGPLAGDQAAMLAVDYTPWCVQSSCGLDEDLVDPVLP